MAPETAALLVRGDAHPFALAGEWAGARAVVGAEPIRVAGPDEDPLAVLDAGLAPPDGDVPPDAVGGGWFGRLGYAVGSRVESTSPSPPRPVPLPEASLALYDHVLVLDAHGRWWFEALVTPVREHALRERLAELRERLGRPPEPRPFSTAPWRSVPGLEGHAAAVGTCRERIAAGDLFQANLCLRLEAELEGELLDLWTTGLPALRPARAAFLGGPWGAVASFSPELFLRRHGSDVASAPIKGTRPRGATPAEDERARGELAGAAKDRAENVMIVDLVRNDLGRVCEAGGVRVGSLAEPRAHVGVWHLVSEVIGVLRERVGNAELVAAAFPPGSVTGAPKVAAMQTIAELESTGRETYCGAIGFASPVAGLELSVAIRTFEARGGRIWLGAGGGVVADSDPAAEALEAAGKAAPLLAAIGGRRAPPPPAAASLRPRRLTPRPIARPDPAKGVFETVLVETGVPRRLEAHLARLATSVEALYGRTLPPNLASSAHEQARDAPSGTARLRIVARLAAAGLETILELEPLAAAPPPATLHPVCLPGGLGAHKWRDRRLVDALAAGAAPGAVTMLVDLDGLVLEAARATVFAARGRELRTPPLDGRILPGVTRAAVLAAAARLAIPVREAPLTLPELESSDEVMLSGALRGLEPVGPAGPVGAALAVALETPPWPSSLPP
jgi:para-aminobenzoate synthetase/4-amino-4-deoxychorismate lyase